MMKRIQHKLYREEESKETRGSECQDEEMRYVELSDEKRGRKIVREDYTKNVWHFVHLLNDECIIYVAPYG